MGFFLYLKTRCKPSNKSFSSLKLEYLIHIKMSTYSYNENGRHVDPGHHRRRPPKHQLSTIIEYRPKWLLSTLAKILYRGSRFAFVSDIAENVNNNIEQTPVWYRLMRRRGAWLSVVNSLKVSTFVAFTLLRLIGIDIVQTTMSVSTLYLFQFSSYIQKTKHDLLLFTFWGPCRQLKPVIVLYITI